MAPCFMPCDINKLHHSLLFRRYYKDNLHLHQLQILTVSLFTHHWLVMMKTVVLFYFLTIFCCYSVSAYKNQIRPYKSNLEKNRAIQYAFCLMFLFNNLRDRHQKLNNVFFRKGRRIFIYTFTLRR